MVPYCFFINNKSMKNYIMYTKTKQAGKKRREKNRK